MTKLFFLSSLLHLAIYASGQIVYSQFANPTGKYSTTSSGVCFSCSISNASNVADNDFSNNATIVVSGGIVTSQGIRAKLPSLVSANTKAGFYINIGAVVASLPSVTLTTYKGGSARETIIAGGNIVSLLGGGLGYICGTASSSLDYDEVGISFTGSLFTVPLSADVFYAFGGASSCPTSALPVKFVDVSVKINNNIPLISWKAEDDGNVVYSLQRSYDGISFTTIHTDTSFRNNALKTFSYSDTNASGENIYYRLEVLDPVSLASFFSKTTYIQNGINHIGKGITVFPNPVTGNSFTVILPVDYRYQYKLNILDKSGRVVDIPSITTDGQTIKGTLHKQLPAGVYVVRLWSLSNTQSLHSRLIIIR